jgi:hypothetical protein
MKRSLSALAASLVILVLTACGGYDRSTVRFPLQERNDLFELNVEPVEGDVPPVTFDLSNLHEQIAFVVDSSGFIRSETRYRANGEAFNRLVYAAGRVPDRTRPNFGFQVGDIVTFSASMSVPEGGLRLGSINARSGTARAEAILGDPNDDENDIVVFQVTDLLIDSATRTKTARISGTIRIDFRLAACGITQPPCSAP